MQVASGRRTLPGAIYHQGCACRTCRDKSHTGFSVNAHCNARNSKNTLSMHTPSGQNLGQCFFKCLDSSVAVAPPLTSVTVVAAVVPVDTALPGRWDRQRFGVLRVLEEPGQVGLGGVT